MSYIDAVLNRRTSLLLNKCKPIQSNSILNRPHNQTIKINSINRLNSYITITDINYEIYGFQGNTLIDYYVTNSLDLDEAYLGDIKRILEYINFKECDVYIFNDQNILTSVKRVSRFESITSNIVNSDNNSKKRSRSDITNDKLYQTLIKDKFSYEVSDEWVSASKTRNSALSDRCLDYYNEYNITNYDDNPSKGKKIRRGFGDFVNQKFKEGIEFEEKVYKFLNDKYKDKIVKICESYQAREKSMCIKTFQEMYKGTPLIYQGVLHNPENQTLGSVDLLVRDDLINEITNNTYNVDKFKSIFPHHHFYYSVDIKNAKLHFNVDNITLRNHTSVKPFKFQLHVYNEALKYMQDIKTSKSFILGNGWKMEKTINKQRLTEESFDFTDKFGTVDFSSKDDYICMEADDAVNWLHELKKSTDWTHKPPSNINIYPNMCNTNDDGYRHIKQKSAEVLKDLTLIAYLSPEHRSRAFKVGIKTWDDPRLNSAIIGLSGKIGEFVDAVLNTNRDKSDKIVFWKTLDPSPQNIFDTSKLEYYIDFETIVKGTKNYVYMIGLGSVFKNSTPEWNYKCFTLDKLDEESERKMYTQLLDHIENTNKKYNVTYKPLYYHWSQVEPHQLNKMIHNLKLPINDIEWFDLYKYFRENVITVKGAFSHSLKSVGKGMYENKLIDTYWDTNILGDNKINIIPFNKYIRNIDTGFNDLIKYNEIDCKIMYDILKVIRSLKI
jgi:hypothetical protein